MKKKKQQDPNISTKTMNFPEKNIGRTLLNINHNNKLLHQSLKAKEIKAKINKWELSKLTSFCTAVENLKRQPVEWEKTFANVATG